MGEGGSFYPPPLDETLTDHTYINGASSLCLVTSVHFTPSQPKFQLTESQEGWQLNAFKFSQWKTHIMHTVYSAKQLRDKMFADWPSAEVHRKIVVT